ncbi:hypothetical protein FQB35_09905 [Crassaminicella thermophila]|uniref:Uncharacterized protein n=1 Tax=Crassaminicella thermophila TaxID=2599308 RepID=A0A5C0SGT8_CRATE|nr:hypothetical protein [Crassaminicella thermophila]QEK12614.1 hypothetical protein FQB35_09905 [Crassaminicella thermophila]
MLSEIAENRLIEIIREHTKLAEEFANFPANGGDTAEEAILISRRKAEIKKRIEELRVERQKLLGK